MVLLEQWYTNLLSPDGVHSQISSSLRLLVFYLVRPDLYVIHYCLFIFSKNSFLSLAPLTNATSAFSTLWLGMYLYGLKSSAMGLGHLFKCIDTIHCKWLDAGFEYFSDECSDALSRLAKLYQVLGNLGPTTLKQFAQFSVCSGLAYSLPVRLNGENKSCCARLFAIQGRCFKLAIRNPKPWIWKWIWGRFLLDMAGSWDNADNLGFLLFPCVFAVFSRSKTTIWDSLI